ncbi:MAG: hypothetical protein ABI620_02350, partial [Chloroflexota bacterium]
PARPAAGAGRAPITAIVGLAGDRPDDTLRGVGKTVAGRVDRLVLKEMLHYLRGRTRESVIGEISAGARDGGWRGELPLYGSEVEAMAGELDRTDLAAEAAGADSGASGNPGIEVIILLCHEQREEVFELLAERGLRPIGTPRELARLVASG